jgi:hypothetical protein
VIKEFTDYIDKRLEDEGEIRDWYRVRL